MRSHCVRSGLGALVALLTALGSLLLGAGPAAAHFDGSKTCTATGFTLNCTLSFMTAVGFHPNGLPANDVLTITLTGNAQYTTASVTTTGLGFGGVGTCTASIPAGGVQPTTITVDIGPSGCAGFTTLPEGTITLTETLQVVAPGGGTLMQNVSSAALTMLGPGHDHTFTATTPAMAPFTLPGFITVTPAPVSGPEGTAVTETVTFVDPGCTATTTYQVTVAWGDGATSITVVGPNPACTRATVWMVPVPHTYLDEGSFPITVTVTGSNMSTGTGMTTATIAEADVLTGTGAAITPTEHVAFTGTVATFTDMGYPGNVPGDFSATINWGDGTATGAGTVTGGAGTFSVSGTHTYADEGPFTVTTTLTDDAPGTATATATSTATVAEADVLTGTPGATIFVHVGVSTGTVVLATFTDTDTTNTAADFTATINWGDGTTTAGTVAGLGAGGTQPFTVSGAHTYTTGGPFTITVTLTDDAPGTATATVTLTANVFTGTPNIGVIGCANSNDPTQIQFSTQPGLFGGNVVSSGTQNVTNSTNANGQAVLSVVAPTSITGVNSAILTAVECGAIFQDNDPDPNTIAGGTITFNLGGLTANGLTIASFLEGGAGTTVTVPCGGFVAGVDTCQGAVTGTGGAGSFTPVANNGTCVVAPCVATPTPSNVVHVALRPGVTFGLIGGISPAITVSATYTRLQAYGAFFQLGTNTATIAIATPSYVLSLTPSPASIPAALGSTTGSTITASLQRVTTLQCVSVSGGFSGFLVCGSPQGILGVSAGSFGLVNGAEPGVVTFATTLGVFGLPGAPLTGAQQVASVHCGPAPATTPVFLVPFLGQPFSFSFSACQSVSVTLFGGGEAGTAVVTGTYVGDFTGATATAATTVALTVSAPTVALTRGCNEVITGPSTPSAATATQILALVSPSSVVVSVWQFNNGLHAFQALYFSTAGAPTDISSVGPNQSLFICVSGSATFTTS